MDSEKTIEFLLEQQLKFAQRMDELLQSHLKLQGSLDRMLTLAERIVMMVESVAKVQEAFSNALLSMAEAQKHTDQQINRMISVIEGYRPRVH